MEADQNEERDGIEHYLRALRKKVDHQVKNPFDLAFANYSFEELASWKNNVLQLDATSRLYGQRVDYLHCGTLQILGSVLTNQEAVRESAEQRQQVIRRQQQHDNLPFERHLEQPQRISSDVEKGQINLMLWREVCKKRDALHQLMLNEISVDRDLGLYLVSSGTAETGGHYDQVLTDQSSIYMKLLDFRALSPKLFGIFAEIDELSSSLDNFMASYAGKARADVPKVQSILEYDFHCLDIDGFAFNDLQAVNFEDGLNCPEISQGDLENQQYQPHQEGENGYSEYEDSQDYFELEDWNRNQKSNRERKTKRQKREGARQKRDQMVDFGGMHLQKTLILLPQTEEQNIKDNYLCLRDYLLCKFIRYNHPVPKKIKKAGAPSKFKPYNHDSLMLPQTTFETMPCSNTQEESFNWNPLTNVTRLSQFTQMRFKEAALPIKEMKKRIKQKVDLQKKELVFQDIKKTFTKEEPLDIFITVLHIAAEQQALIVV